MKTHSVLSSVGLWIWFRPIVCIFKAVIWVLACVWVLWRPHFTASLGLYFISGLIGHSYVVGVPIVAFIFWSRCESKHTLEKQEEVCFGWVIFKAPSRQATWNPKSLESFQKDMLPHFCKVHILKMHLTKMMSVHLFVPFTHLGEVLCSCLSLKQRTDKYFSS